MSKDDSINYTLPRYNEIPNVGLYLKQTVKFINEITCEQFGIKVTETMLSNYVKLHIISNPIKKQYYRDQIASLLFIVLAKNILSLDNIQFLLHMQQETYTTEIAYDYFCSEFENVTAYVFGQKSSLEKIGNNNRDEKNLLRNIVITLGHKLYLEHCFSRMKEISEPSAQQVD